MLGRRAAIGSSILALAVVGGSGAYAATHGSSHSSSKPKVTKVVRPHRMAKPSTMMYGANVRSGHHCNHEGVNASQL
jgi:hypothetical protein